MLGGLGDGANLVLETKFKGIQDKVKLANWVLEFKIFKIWQSM